MLAKVRQKIKEKQSEQDVQKLNEVMNEIYIAEGSDWFWWYGDTHIAENKSDFDVLFRWHIGNIYKLLGEEIPKDVEVPIGKRHIVTRVIKQEGPVTPSIDGKVSTEDEWIKAGYYDAQGSMTAMHQVGELLTKLWYAKDNNNIYLRFDLVKELDEDDSIEVQFLNPKNFILSIRKNIFEIKSEDAITINQFSYSNYEIVELSFSKSTFFSDNTSEIKLELTIQTRTKEGEICYPRQGSLELVM